MRGALTLPACAVLGLPLSVASTVPSITHVISLTTYDVQQMPGGERKVPTKVVENLSTDKYVTMTIFQLEKEFGDSEEAKEFIQELIKGNLDLTGLCLR